MLMISREAIESVIAIKQKLADPKKKAECIADIEKTIEMKQSHLWRADAGSCCANLGGVSCQFEAEINILQGVLDALKEDDSNKAAARLEDYLAFLEKSYEPEPPSLR